MLWSLLKLLLFVAAVAGLTLAVARIADTGAGLRIAIGDTEFVLGPIQAVLVVLAVLLGLWLVLKVIGLTVALLRFLNGDETAISRYFSRARERRGFEALVDATLALASGEGRTAASKAAKAEKLLRRPELTALISAQAAELEGDRARAESYFTRLVAEERTRFVGVRGLLRQKIAAGETEAALQLAQNAFALKPGHAETQDVLLRLQTGTSDWAGARSTLRAKKQSGHLPRDVYSRRDAVLALQEAQRSLDAGQTAEAAALALEANALSPELVPAAVMAARAHVAEGRGRKATKVIRRAWQAAPHPDLAAAFAEIEPQEAPPDRLSRFDKLFRLHPDAAETRLLRAELHIAAEEFPEARRALGDLPETAPGIRALTIMAAIERGEGGNDAVVRGWLARALTAPRGPQWCCDKCQNIHADWRAVCAQCGGFDTLSWREPAEQGGPSATRTEMLPLIVGTPAPVPAPGRDIDAEPLPRGDDAEVPPVAEDDPDPARQTPDDTYRRAQD
jgi:HemY protein